METLFFITFQVIPKIVFFHPQFSKYQNHADGYPLDKCTSRDLEIPFFLEDFFYVYAPSSKLFPLNISSRRSCPMHTTERPQKDQCHVVTYSISLVPGDIY